HPGHRRRRGDQDGHCRFRWHGPGPADRGSQNAGNPDPSRPDTKPLTSPPESSSLSDLTFGPLISLAFFKFVRNTIPNDINILRGTQGSRHARIKSDKLPSLLPH